MLAVRATQAPLTALAVPGAAGLVEGAGEAAGLGLALANGLAEALDDAGELAGAAPTPQPARSRAAEALSALRALRRVSAAPGAFTWLLSPRRRLSSRTDRGRDGTAWP